MEELIQINEIELRKAKEEKTNETKPNSLKQLI